MDLLIDDLSFEFVSLSIPKGSKVSKEGVIKNVHLIGLQAKNKKKGKKEPYKYTNEAVSGAITNGLYNNRPIFFGHSDKISTERDPRDRAGFVTNSKFKEGVGGVGDLQLDPKHPNFESIKWWAENKSDELMMSHVSYQKYNESTNAIDEIYFIDSVDFVIKGSTTDSLFKEGVIADAIEADEQANKLKNIVYTAQSLLNNVLWPITSYDSNGKNKVLTDAEKSVMMLPIAQDLVRELKTFNSTTESIKVNDMEYKDITLESFKKERSDLFKAIEASAIAVETKLTKDVESLVAEIPVEKRTKLFMKAVRESVQTGNLSEAKEHVSEHAELTKETVESKVVVNAAEKAESDKKVEKTVESVKVTEQDILAAFNINN